LAIKRSTVADSGGLPPGVISAPANPHDSQLLARTLDVLKHVVLLPVRTCVDVDSGYDSDLTRNVLAEHGPKGRIARKVLAFPATIGPGWRAEPFG
jgi:IS5 family transposase